jgi:hypothetical protein
LDTDRWAPGQCLKAFHDLPDVRGLDAVATPLAQCHKCNSARAASAIVRRLVHLTCWSKPPIPWFRPAQYQRFPRREITSGGVANARLILEAVSSPCRESVALREAASWCLRRVACTIAFRARWFNRCLAHMSGAVLSRAGPDLARRFLDVGLLGEAARNSRTILPRSTADDDFLRRFAQQRK